MHKIIQSDPEIWNLFTSKEEYNNLHRDQYERFPYYASKNRNIFEPLVSQYLINHNFRVEFPGNAPFAVCLTHDIDTIYKPLIYKGIDMLLALKKGDANNFFILLKQIQSKKNPFCNFSNIMNLEKKYGAKSTFFVLAETQEEPDFQYNIEDINKELGEIIENKWEIGLHGGSSVYLDAHMMMAKKKVLEKLIHKEIIGYRSHFLQFHTPDTWVALSKAGFKYDTTFGYADCAGFRNGICHPFKPYNLNTDQEINILEIPLILMDCTLGLYMELDEDKKWELIKGLIERVAECRGIFTILWHNTFMSGSQFELYEKILAYCYKKNAWMTNCEEIYYWFQNYY
ncbi:MAG: hypothetical protein GXY48_12475 [Methanomicrobiales archaeon]|nr:hypothetical protein [Methanomicrobiales archaeon]